MSVVPFHDRLNVVVEVKGHEFHAQHHINVEWRSLNYPLLREYP